MKDSDDWGSVGGDSEERTLGEVEAWSRVLSPAIWSVHDVAFSSMKQLKLDA